MPVAGDHAVVIGGSIAGLASAKVLSRFFDTVTIVERDELPEHATHHRGVPQSPHLHGVLYGGRLTLDEIYDGDGFTDALRDAGGVYFDFARHNAVRFPEGWIKRAPGDMMVVMATRWAIEHVIRVLTKQVSNIAIDIGQVTGLTTTGQDRRVCGVRVKSDDGERVIGADLVVDAAGRGSKAPKWLEDIGYRPPAESVVRSFLGYSTVYGQVPEDAWPGDIKCLVAPPFPGNTRGGFICPQEDGLVGIMAAGQSRDYPPGDPDGFTEFMRTAITPVLSEIWERCTPETEIKTTKTSHNRLRRWHELERRAGGFVSVGDALAAFNPVYGSGITVAALHAKALGQALGERDQLDDVVSHFPDDALTTSQYAWTAATDADLQFPATEVRNLPLRENDPQVMQYRSKLRLATTLDAGVALAFREAQGKLDGSLMFDPALMSRVEEVCASADGPHGDQSRPPEFSDDQAPLAIA